MKRTAIVLMLAAGVAHADPHDRRDYPSNQQCWDEVVNDQKGYGGAILGGIAGGLLGSQVGAGNGRTAAAVVGAATGAIVGDRIDNSGRHVVTRCRPVGARAYEAPPRREYRREEEDAPRRAYGGDDD